MAIDHQRVYFSRPAAASALHFRGRLYNAASADNNSLWKIVNNPTLLNHCEADLAIAAFDRDKDCWRLVRDFGQTPIYYSPSPGGFAWSFTYSGLLELIDKPQADEATLFDFICTHYRYIFRDPARTFHHNVFEVPAGAFVDISEKGIETHHWLDLSHDPQTFKLGPKEATGRLMEILRDSVRLRVKGAQRPAFTVSSGLDSATVASLAAEHLGSIDVFSVGYSGQGAEEYDETEGVSELVKGKDWRWTHLVLQQPDLIEETKKLISQTHSPVVTVTWLAYYLMAKQMTGFKELFNGLGGDESLAGEFVHFFYFFADLKKQGLNTRLNEEVEAWSRLHDHPVFKKNWEVLKKNWANINFDTGQMMVDKNVYQANWRFFDPERIRAFGSLQPPMPTPYPDFLSNRLYQEIKYETTPPTLWGQFMANQALGITGVSPFMSVRLFKLCLSLSGTVKYDQGLTKALLRRGLVGVLPESLRLNHKKVGFNAPIHQWFKESKVAGPALELFKYGPLAKCGWLKKGAAEKIFKEHESGQANHMMLLWSLLNASLFLEIYS